MFHADVVGKILKDDATVGDLKIKEKDFLVVMVSKVCRDHERWERYADHAAKGRSRSCRCFDIYTPRCCRCFYYSCLYLFGPGRRLRCCL